MSLQSNKTVEMHQSTLLTQLRKESGILPTMARRISPAAISRSSVEATSE